MATEMASSLGKGTKQGTVKNVSFRVFLLSFLFSLFAFLRWSSRKCLLLPFSLKNRFDAQK